MQRNWAMYVCKLLIYNKKIFWWKPVLLAISVRNNCKLQCSTVLNFKATCMSLSVIWNFTVCNQTKFTLVSPSSVYASIDLLHFCSCCFISYLCLYQYMGMSFRLCYSKQGERSRRKVCMWYLPTLIWLSRHRDDHLDPVMAAQTQRWLSRHSHG